MKRNFFNRISHKFNFFDYVLFGLFAIASIGLFIFLFRKNSYVTIKLKVTEKSVLYANTTPPYWFVYLFKKGMKEADGLGRSTAEVTDVYFYESSPTTKSVYLTIKLRTTYNPRTQEYKYKGTTVSVGEGIRINLGTIVAEGLITEVESLKNPYSYVSLLVNAVIQDNNQVFSETTGVDEFVADAVNVGNKVYDSQGEAIAEILEKKVLPAQKNTTDALGNSYMKTDPRKKDVFLTLKVRAKKIYNELYFLDDIRLKVWLGIPLQFEHITIWPTITNFSVIK